MSKNTSSYTPNIHYDKKRWGNKNKFKVKIINRATHCFFDFSKVQYTPEKKNLKNVSLETELRTDGKVRFV